MPRPNTKAMKQLGKRLCNSGSALFGHEQYGDTGSTMCDVGTHLYTTAAESELQTADIANDTIARAILDAKLAVEALSKAELPERTKPAIKALLKWFKRIGGPIQKPAAMVNPERAHTAITFDLLQDAEELLALAKRCKERVNSKEYFDERLVESEQCLKEAVSMIAEIHAHYSKQVSH